MKTTATSKIKARELQPGSLFHRPGQIKFRKVKFVFETDEMPRCLEAHAGKLLVIYDGCRQMILDKETELITRQTPVSC